MNWKYRLLSIFTVVLAAVILVKLPSQATNNETDSSKNYDETIRRTVTQIGDFSVVAPSAFGVSENISDVPNSVPDAFLRRVFYVTKNQMRELALEKEALERGITKEQIVEEINALNLRDLKKIIPGAGAGDNFKDPLMDNAVSRNAPQAMPTPDLTFNGNTQADNAAQGFGGVLPPDVIGDVGPNHYVHAVNLVFSVFNKTGTRVAGPVRMSSLFSGMPTGSPCRRDDGDPTVAYDQLADRWVLTQFALPTGLTAPTYQCIAVSQTPDPTGAYYAYQFAYPNSVVNDYPKFGVWRDAYYMTTNEFTSGGTGFAGAGMLAFDRDKMLVGDPTATLIIRRVTTSGGVLPSDIEGFGGPPTDLDHIFLEFRSDETGDPFDGVRAFRFRPDFVTPANTIFQVINDVALAPFDPRNPPGRLDIEQQGGTNLESLSGRLMHRMSYRNLGTQAAPINSYVSSFTVNTSGLSPTTPAAYDAGIRWFELRRPGNSTITIFDQGTQSDTGGTAGTRLNNWMGSIGQDNRGDIALGYSQSGTTQNADVKIAGRTKNVTNSGTLNEGEALFFDATGSQTSTSGRWGDYSSMNLDSEDDCTFWYTQEYYAATSAAGWSTRIGKFKFPQCTAAQKATIQGTITDCATGAPIAGALVDSTGGFTRVTAADGTYSMTVAPGTYTVTGKKGGGFPAAAQTVTVTGGQTATINFCLTGVAVVQSGAVNITTESCGAANSTPDPGETLTVSLPLQNTGAANTTNLTATLQATGGVINPGAAQSYGAIAPGSAATSRNFTFTVDPNLPCGSTVTLTFVVSDGTITYPNVTQSYTTGVRTVSFSERFDGVTAPALPAGWTNVQLSGTAINWVTSTTTPSSPPNAAFANNPTTVNLAALVSPPIAIVGTDSQMAFKNNYATEVGFDGMVLEFTTNGGTTWTDVITGGGSFVTGGYNRTLSTGSMIPLSGRMAWSGSSNGYIDSTVNLPTILNGQTVQFRWLMGSDNGTGGAGVRIDDVQVFGARVCQSCNNPGACRIQRRNDFTGDGITDFSVFRPSSGTWFIQPNGAGNASGVNFGISTDKLQPADYNGDGKTDIGIFRSGVWYWIRSSDNTVQGYQWGTANDIPVVGDYTGDGKSDLAVYRPSNGIWYILNSSTNAMTAMQWGGIASDVPIVGDFDGDCKTDLAIRRMNNPVLNTGTTFYILQSSGGATSVDWGTAEMQPAIGDYNGDGKSDVGVVNARNGQLFWYVISTAATVLINGTQFGQASDVIVPGDYDGDAKTDIAVWRPSSGTFFFQSTGSGANNFRQFGTSGDVPTARASQYPLP